MFSIRVDKEISLKLPTLKNADEFFALVERNRTFLRQYLPWVDHTLSVENSKTYIKECRKQFKSDSGYSLCIFYRQNIVGAISSHSIDQIDCKTEIGYWLAEDQQGKGIMRRSCLALMTYLFETLQLHRIEIRIVFNNLTSQRIPEKLGFTKEGILRESAYINDKFHDVLIYGLLASDFNKKMLTRH